MSDKGVYRTAPATPALLNIETSGGEKVLHQAMNTKNIETIKIP